MEIKSVDQRLRQDQMGKDLGCLSSILPRYRNDSLSRISPNNTNKRRQKISNTNLDENLHRERDVKRHEMTSKDLN